MTTAALWDLLNSTLFMATYQHSGAPRKYPQILAHAQTLHIPARLQILSSFHHRLQRHSEEDVASSCYVGGQGDLEYQGEGTSRQFLCGTSGRPIKSTRRRYRSQYSDRLQCQWVLCPYQPSSTSGWSDDLKHAARPRDPASACSLETEACAISGFHTVGLGEAGTLLSSGRSVDRSPVPLCQYPIQLEWRCLQRLRWCRI